MELDEKTKEVTNQKRIREEEKEENGTWRADRKCVNLVSAEAFDFFSQGDDWESCCGLSPGDPLVKADDLSDCDPEYWAGVCAVPDVTVVLVSPSSDVTECLGVPPWIWTGNLLSRSPLLSAKSVLAFGQFRRKV